MTLLAQHDANATFFVSGRIAEKHPEILASIVTSGHEVAAQCYYQQTIREIPPAAFRDDIRRSRDLLEFAIGRQVQGFRIGRGWIGPDDLWALDVIRDQGFRYDASVCPSGRRFVHGKSRFVIDWSTAATRDLIEVPTSSIELFGYAAPFAGGNYLRQSPAWFTRWALSRWTAKSDEPLVAYFHIWELDRSQPSITAAGFWQRLRHYRNLPLMRERISTLLSSYHFTTVCGYLGLDQSPLSRASQGVHPQQSRPMTPVALGTAPVPPSTPDQQSPRELSLIVPCFNEQASIPYLERTLTEFADNAGAQLALSYVFLDDGSTDTTWNDLQARFGTWSGTEFVRLPTNRGIAAAILAGAAVASTELVAVIDADCTFDPNQIVSMLPLLTDDVSVVVASPFQRPGDVRHVPAWRLALSHSATFLYRCVMRNQLTSYTSCFRIYRRAQIADMKINDGGFCGVTETLTCFDLDGRKVVECPAVLQVRLLGESKIRVFRVILDHVRLLCRIFTARYLATKMR